MTIFKTDVAFLAMTFVSMGVLHVIKQDTVLGGRSEWPFAVLPVLFMMFLFLAPLCQGFSLGIAHARDSVSDPASVSTTARFRRMVRPRIGCWLVIWTAYLIVLDLYVAKVVGVRGLLVSLPSAGLVLLMTASCLVWAPRCRKLRTLALLTLLTPLVAFILSGFIAFKITWLLSSLGVIQWYSGLEFLVLPPLITSGLLFVTAIGAWFWVRRKGDAWLRE